jgi:hypothetical protein
VIIIEHEGKTFDWPDLLAWQDHFESVGVAGRERMLTLATEGEIRNEDGPVLGADLRRTRAQLLGARPPHPEDLPWVGSRRARETETRWLIPGLWPWGHKPVLGGNPKAGKTTLIADLAVALTTPGRRFLNHFEPACIPPGLEEGEWNVLVINAETPAQDFEAELWRAGLSEDASLRVDHLEEEGGPQSFDLTDPEVYELRSIQLVACEACDRTDDYPPSVVIVDGVTAILQAAGKGPEAYGAWYAQFRRLMHETGTEHALAVFHNTLSGGHPMGGVEAMSGPDGLWTLSMDDINRSDSPRRFSAVLRSVRGSVTRSRVRFNEEGRQTLIPPKERGASARPTRPAAPQPPMDDRVMDFVIGCNADGNGPTTTELRRAVKGDNAAIDAAVARLEESGRFERRKRGRGYGLWAVGRLDLADPTLLLP